MTDMPTLTAADTYMSNLGAYPCEFHFIGSSDRDRMEKHLSRSFGPKDDGLISAHISGSSWRSQHPDVAGVPHFFLGDIRKLAGRDILDAIGLEPGELDLVTGGPPCQGYSRAGKRNIMDPRNSLVFEFARLVCETKPKTMVFENVPDIVNMTTPDGVPVLDAFCRILEDGGFGGFDAFRRTFRAQAGAVGLMRGKSAQARKKPSTEAEQLDLFEVAS